MNTSWRNASLSGKMAGISADGSSRIKTATLLSLCGKAAHASDKGNDGDSAPLPSQVKGAKAPSRTNSNGSIFSVLPKGLVPPDGEIRIGMKYAGILPFPAVCLEIRRSASYL